MSLSKFFFLVMTRQGAAAHRRHSLVRHEQKIKRATTQSSAFARQRERRMDVHASDNSNNVSGRQRRKQLFALHDDMGFIQQIKPKKGPSSGVEPRIDRLVNDHLANSSNSRRLDSLPANEDVQALDAQFTLVQQFLQKETQIKTRQETPRSDENRFDKLLLNMSESKHQRIPAALDRNRDEITDYLDQQFAQDEQLPKNEIRTRKDWVAHGGDNTYRMNEENEEVMGGGEEVVEGDAQCNLPSKAQSDNILQDVLDEIDSWILNSEQKTTKETQQFLNHLSVRLSDLSQSAPTVLMETVQATLLLATKRSEHSALYLLWFVLSHSILPLCDAWHPIVSPLRLLLSSQLISEINTADDLVFSFFCASLLHSMTKQAKAFVGELFS